MVSAFRGTLPNPATRMTTDSGSRSFTPERSISMSGRREAMISPGSGLVGCGREIGVAVTLAPLRKTIAALKAAS